jgi:hypothetical protein
MKIPKNGFYYHYKYESNGSSDNYIYEVVGIARNTEEKSFAVLYRPLYKNDWLAPADYQSRLLTMFNERVLKNSNMVPRFELITDEKIIIRLDKVRAEMYAENN